jgi:hypothetical protein
MLFVVLVALAGCGSSSGTSSSAATGATGAAGSLTTTEFIAQADALCEASKTKQEPLRRQVEELARSAREEEREQGSISTATRRELAQALTRIVAMAEGSLARVKALGPPSADASQLGAIFKKTESAFASSRAYGTALEHREDAKAQSLAERGNAETQETTALAKRYGFRVCGSQP